jgi:hypothetical protein
VGLVSFPSQQIVAYCAVLHDALAVLGYVVAVMAVCTARLTENHRCEARHIQWRGGFRKLVSNSTLDSQSQGERLFPDRLSP